MGCDIHMLLEVKDWQHKPDGSETDDQEWGVVMTETATYGARNYSVFAALANVRNYNDAITPIAEPRGIPEDASEETKARHGRWGVDAHSASWLSLGEVLEHDWTKVPHGGEFFEWAKALNSGPTRIGYRDLADVRLVFWFDN